ncbi:FbpB family small basic protein [Sediminibacillus massiliensis]|nr:FbpB family small basic protein [Sediminibacillus massiliensis]
MRKKKSLEDLIKENRDQILQDSSLLEQIEERMEQKWNAKKSN